MQYVSTKDLAKIYPYNFQTIRHYLCRGEFAKYIEDPESKRIKILWCPKTKQLLDKFLYKKSSNDLLT